MPTTEMTRSGQPSPSTVPTAPHDVVRDAPAASPAAGRTGVRLLVLHRDELVLWGCRAAFGRQEWISRCIVAAELSRAVALARRYEPHVALVHVGHGDSAAALTSAIRAVDPHLHVVLMAESGRFTELDARAAGAVALATSHLGVAGLVALARDVASGTRPPLREPADTLRLSARERQVLSHLATGATNREIGNRLVLSPDTIKNHVSRAYRKLGARNRLEAVNRARDLGLIS